MAVKPIHIPVPPIAAKNQTPIAIGVSLLISVVLGSLVAGNPFRAFHAAYIEYAHVPAATPPTAAGAPAAPAPASPAPAAARAPASH